MLCHDWMKVSQPVMSALKFEFSTAAGVVAVSDCPGSTVSNRVYW